jgi:ABC-type phosphate/phosphonate transport system substrate-binding protein
VPERSLQSFCDLRGSSWAYNEPHSQSGYGIARYHLVCRGEANCYFGRVVEAGWHERALRLVACRAVDAAAIECQAFLLNLANDPVARPHLDRALVQGFVPVNDESYDDIRAMLAAVEARAFLALLRNLSTLQQMTDAGPISKTTPPSNQVAATLTLP